MRGLVDFSDAFASVLTKHRKAAGLSRQALADKAGIHYTYVGLIERKERNPSMDVADALARALGVPLSRLVQEAEAIRAKSQS